MAELRRDGHVVLAHVGVYVLQCQRKIVNAYFY